MSRFAVMPLDELKRSVEQSGWIFYFTKETAAFTTHIWYHTGRKDEYGNIEAKFWLKKAYSNTTTYEAVDYQVNFEIYSSLIGQKDQLGLTFIEHKKDARRDYNSYLKEGMKYDFITYIGVNMYGLIISLEK